VRKRGTGGRLTCAAGAPDPPAARENDERSLAQNLTRSRLGLGLRRQRERRRGKRIERGGRERGRGSEGVDGGSAATVSTLRRMAKVTVGEARRAREIAGGSVAAYGGGDGRMARVTGGVEVYIPGRCRAGHIYRAVLGPSPWADQPAQARHGPRAGPARARRLPCQAVLGPCLAVPGHGPSGGPARNGHV